MLIKKTWHSVSKYILNQVMKHRIHIALLFIITSIKGFSQDTLKTNPFIANNFAVVEITRNGAFDNEVTLLHFDDGKITDVTAIVYGKYKDLPIAQEALRCIKYMKERNYYLMTSTVSTASGNHPGWTNVYDYQYIFEKREK